MVTLLTLKQEVQGSNPDAAPAKSLEPIPLIPRLQVAMKRQGSPPPKKGPCGTVQAEGRAPGMTLKN